MSAVTSATQVLLIILFVISKCLKTTSGSDNPLIVTSPAGAFKGTTLLSLQGHVYVAFLSIPFALPPVGPLRFAKPRPFPKIEHVYDASQFGPICIQPAGIDIGSPAQEDCLYLNVYVPDTNTKDKDEGKKLKKVYFYIYGGGFFMGSSREHVPGDLVALGDVIVVTINYRLSWLGFLKGNTTELPGNQGMWDQLMALHWVKDNIQSFGGDSDDITLGGDSMGGESVSAWSIVPLGKGLFTKGHIMSGTMFTSPSTPGSSDVLLDMLTDRVGCKHANPDAAVSCLRELPAEAFVLPLQGGVTNKFTTIDGDLFPSPIKDLIRDKDYLEEVGFFDRSYIVSVTNNEGAVEFHGPFDLGIDPDKMTANFLSQKLHFPVPVCEKMLTWYQEPGHFAFKPAHDIFDDHVLGFPTYKFLETASLETVEEKKGKSYFLYFDYLPSYLPPALEGMGHGFDLLYLFDLQPDQMLQYYYRLHTSKTLSELDFEMKRNYIDMLTDFMKLGDPSVTLKKKFDIQWPVFDVQSAESLVFNSTPSVKPSPLKERWHFWNELFPKYMKDYTSSIRKGEL